MSFSRPRALFICGSINQTKQMLQISRELNEFDHWFTPYYATGLLSHLQNLGLMEMTIAGRRLSNIARDYLLREGVQLDERGAANDYDLVVTCTDQLVQHNIARRPLVLVQEGMLDPQGFLFHLNQALPLVPRWLAGTAATGQSKAYQRFCVASEGYREHFLSTGLSEDSLVVTGIPNFDDCEAYRTNDFPHRGYVLVCTSDARETFKRDDRESFISNAVRVAAGRQLIFKLHPNENFARAEQEVRSWAPGALVFRHGSAEEMVANSDVLICQWSSLAFVGLALGKEVYSNFELESLRRLLPLQGGGAARRIAKVCREVAEEAWFSESAGLVGPVGAEGAS